jgi:SNF2 family DNA or RNA helicase/uncharacterized Zn finger protein
MRKTYGNTWWGKQWLSALSDIDFSNRLPRGRTYANTGKVIDISVKYDRIQAKVQGTRSLPYRINLAFPKLTEPQKKEIIEQIMHNPIYLSQLLNRKLPIGLANYCQENKIKIFPKNWHDLTLDCSCPDWATPCKHQAAVLYIFSLEIDKDPFLVFKLQGLNIFEELERHSIVIESKHQNTIAEISESWVDFVDYAEETPELLPLLDKLDYTIIPDCRDTLFSVISEKPPFYHSGDFKKILEKTYGDVAKKYAKYVPAEEDADDKISFFYQTDEMNIIISDELEFKEIICYSDEELIFQTKELTYLIEWLDSAPVGQLPNYSHPIMALYAIYHFAIKLLQKSAYIPQVIKSNRNRYGIRWLPAMISKEVKQIDELLEELMPEGTIAFNFVENGKRVIKMSKTEEQASILTSIFLRHFIAKAFLESDKYYEKDVELLFFYEEYISFSDFESKEIPRLVHLWLSKFFINKKDYIPLIKVEETDDNFKLQLFIENRVDESQNLISIEELFTSDDLEDVKVGALQDIALLIEHFPDIEKLLQNEDYSLLYSFQEFTEILLKILPAIQLFGIKILLPKALRKLAMPKASMEIFSDTEEGEVGQTSGISLDNLLKFNWKVAVGDQLIPVAEFEKMVQGLSGIVKIKDQFVLVDGKEMESLLEKIKNPPKVTAQEILQSALAEEYNGATVVLDAKAQKILNDLLNIDEVAQPKDLLATLRPYQERGYEWLYKNSKIGFGSLIADDMGLGKTLQVITTLLKFKQEGLLKKQKVLAILPTTLLTNWQKEIIKFAPELNVQVYHGTNRKLNVKDHDIILTTYGIARTETTELSKIKWQVLILDEAQNIKNPQTGQTKAIKKLKANVKIAMTGTPVENRLSEYWSIFDFINKGYLFGLKKFKDKFARPIELDRDKHALEQFRKITSPFILRRVKTDKTIIQDLPDKIETNQFCNLTKKQAALYQNVVDNMLQQVEKTEAIERRGLILKLLTALKQICNHPSQYLKLGDIKADESGKTELLLDLLRQIFNANQKVIIFTQYRQMGDLLMKLIKEELNVDVPFLHGGVSRKNRDLMVDNFQEKTYVKAMLISLKAGGTGLNLTAASNVIHYDLWWNPAVEAQATDRAYRIGQKQNVQVHRFITEKTFEEKIDKLIQSKKELANLAVASGENWLGDMTNADLKELVRLE